MISIVNKVLVLAAICDWINHQVIFDDRAYGAFE